MAGFELGLVFPRTLTYDQPMHHIELFGTVTSPYVRRVRVLLAELGLAYELVNTAESAGQELLRSLNPVWKVPALRIDGELVFDSRIIAQYLMHRFGPGPLLALDAADPALNNLLTVTDGALDALINVFYMEKEGVTRERAPYLKKQYERAAAALGWLETRVSGPWLSRHQGFGLPELGLVTALEWMRFRQVYPIETHPPLVEFLKHHQARHSLSSTAP